MRRIEYLIVCLSIIVSFSSSGCSTIEQYAENIKLHQADVTTNSSPGERSNEIKKPISCSVNIKSDVEGVSVTIDDSGSSWGNNEKITWITNAAYKKIDVSCANHTVKLTKNCYPEKKVDVSFQQNNSYDIYVKKDEWLKYAYLRAEYKTGKDQFVGDVPFIVIKGLTQEPYQINKNENLVTKIGLGKYAIDIYAKYKSTASRDISVCNENDIYILNVLVKSPDEVEVEQGDELKLGHGVGVLRVINDKSNTVFSLTSKETGKTDKYKGPTVIKLPFGEYKIQFGNKQENILINTGNEILFDLSISQ